MKQIITPQYIFNPTAGTLNLFGIPNFNLQRLYGVINLTCSEIVYAPGESEYGASASGSTLTLAASMSGMAATDELAIVYDFQEGVGNMLPLLSASPQGVVPQGFVPGISKGIRFYLNQTDTVSFTISNFQPINPGVGQSNMAMAAYAYSTSGQKFGIGCCNAAGNNGGVASGAALLAAINSSNYTMEGWAKTLAAGTAILLPFGCLPGGPWVGMTTSGYACMSYAGSILNSTVAVNDGNWHHWALSVSTVTGGKLFIDGVLAVSSATPGPSGGTATGFGAAAFGFGGGNDNWNGQVQEVAVWNYPRYSSNFTPPTAVYTWKQPGLIGLWHLQSDGIDGAGNGFLLTPSPLTMENINYDTTGMKFGTGALPVTNYGTTSAAAVINALDSGNYTIEGWIKTSSAASNILIPFGALNAAPWVGMDSSGHAVAAYVGYSVNLTTTTAINDGNWHHVRLAVGGLGGYLFVDGTLVASNTSPGGPPSASTAATFGVGPFGFGGGNDNWNGEVDNVSVWDHCLSTTGFSVPTGPYTGNPSGLVAQWSFDGNGFDTAGNLGNVGTFTISGAVTGPNWDEKVPPGMLPYVTAFTGTPQYRPY